MKKFLIMLLSIIFIFALAACEGEKDPPGGGGGSGGSGGSGVGSPWSIDLSGYVADISDATALGLADQNSIVSAKMFDANNKIELGKITFLNAETGVAKTNGSGRQAIKKYILKSTAEYDANQPDVDATGLTKVSFIKTVTENVQTETQGEKIVNASDGKLTFAAVKDFTYQIRHGSQVIFSDLKDNDANDANTKEGVIAVAVEKDVAYKVGYHGVGQETVITQDEIDGEVDKLCVLRNYTFISFVPKGTSQRPDDKDLVFDNDGISNYDKTNYFSSKERQSFVIDNTTGYVYKLENFNIKEIKNGLFLSNENNFIYDVKVNDNDELEIFSLFTNTTIQVSDFFKDKYGNNFIKNSTVDQIDYEKNTVFYTQKYYHSDDNTIIYIDHDIRGSAEGDLLQNIREIKKLGENLTFENIDALDVFSFNDQFYSKYNDALIAHIENLFLYTYYNDGAFTEVRVSRYNILTGEEESAYFGRIYGDNRHICAIDYDVFVIIDGNSSTRVELSYFVVDFNDFSWMNENGYSSNYWLESVKIQAKVIEKDIIWNNVELYSEWNNFTRNTINETLEYEAVLVEKDGVKAVELKQVSEYQAGDSIVVKLQPLNK